MFKPIVPIIWVTPQENAELQEHRRTAILDAAERHSPRLFTGLLALWGYRGYLEVLGRSREGHVMARITVRMPHTRRRYRRAVRVNLGPSQEKERTVALRVVP